VTLKDNKGVSYSSSADLVVPTYSTLPAGAALSSSAVKPADRGFKIRTYQIDGGTQDGTIAYNDAILAGQNGPNVANLEDAGGVDAKGYFTWTSYINFDTTGGANGYFNDPDFVTSPFPGIPGTPETGGAVENFAEELVAALEFPAAGMYTMVVNTDWTGFPNASDGYLVRAGTDPLKSESSVRVGFFDALAPAGPERGLANTPFQFYVSKAGIYPFRLMYYQTTGSANLEWFTVGADGKRTLINDTGGIPAYFAWTAGPSTPPSVSITRVANGLSIAFTGTLQSADSVSGPWTDLGAASPLIVADGSPTKFYRAKQ
jgi:hypothetical protein